MDEIIYLEPDEEITSVIDKIKNSKTKSIGLVVPREATLLQSVVNLRLLSREAGFLGKDIAIVTTDRIGQNLASQVGLVVYNSIEEQKPKFVPPPPKPEPSELIEIDASQTVELDSKSPADVPVHHFQEVKKPNLKLEKEAPALSPKPFVLKEKPNNELVNLNAANHVHQKAKEIKILKKLLWPIIAILLILVLVGTYLLLPKAEAVVYVPSDNYPKTLAITISKDAKNEDAATLIVPGELIEASAEREEKFSTTGKKTIGDKAHGTITIENHLDSNGHAFAAGTKLSLSSKTFLTKQAVTVPGAGVSGGTIVPGSIKVEIEAENPGSEYNIKAGRFTILGLPANQQESIYGTSTDAMTGGMSKEVQVVSSADFNDAKNKLIADLTVTVNQDFAKKTKDQKILEKAVLKPDPQITSSANIDQEAKDFTMKVSMKEQVMIFDNTEVKKFLENVLQTTAPADKMIGIPSEESMGLIVDKTDYEKGNLSLTANVAAKISPKIDLEKLRSAITGKSRSDAISYLKSQPGINKADVFFHPVIWFKKLPILQKNVTVKIEYEENQ